MIRKVIAIDREKCNGCGECITACAEAALELDGENKAVLLKEMYCDGMGVCLDVCPSDALRIVEKESDEYDPLATLDHVVEIRGKESAKHIHGILSGESHKETAASALSQWPIQLHLVSPHAPYFRDCDLLVAADCTAFTLGSFHKDLLKRKKLIIACPKLDDTAGYVEKLAAILGNRGVRNLMVATMEVPCCSGLLRLVENAANFAGVRIPIKNKVVTVKGELKS